MTARGFGVLRRPVTIRGITYRDGHAAADAHGVTPGAIAVAACRGSLDRVGMRGHGPRQSLRVGGVQYPSCKAFAEAAGVGEQAVTRARKQGQFALEAIARRGGLPSYYGRPQCRPGAVTEHTHPRTQR